MTGGSWNRYITQSRLSSLWRSFSGPVTGALARSSAFAWARKIAGRSFFARLECRLAGWPKIRQLAPLGRVMESPWGAWLAAGAPAAALLMPFGAGFGLIAGVFAAVILPKGTGKAIGGLPVRLCILATAWLIPTAFSRLPVQSLTIWALWVSLLLLAALAASAVAGVHRCRLYMALSWVSILMGTLACIQALSGWGDVAGWVALSLRPSTPFRSTGFFGNPNVFGTVINLVLWPLAFAHDRSKRSRSEDILRSVALILLSVALLLTRSRAAVLGALVALVIRLRTKTQRRLSRVILAVGALGAFLMLSGGVFGFDALAGAVGTRWSIWQSALRLFAERPLLGQGPGAFAEFVASTAFQPEHAHNVLLQFLAETGLIGTVPVIWFFGALARRIVHHTAASAEGQSGGLVLGIGAALTAVAIQSQFDFSLASGTVAMLVWIWTGFAWGASGYGQRILPGEIR